MERATSRADLAEAIALAEERGWPVHRVRLGKVRSKRGLLEAWHAVIPFPDWFDWNWAAFADAAFEGIGAPALIVIEGWQPWAEGEPAEWDRFTTVLGEHAPGAECRVLLA
jgi:hypothetical protein